MKKTGKLVSKRKYSIPTMQEIADVEKNGLVVVSTFSGCGGSCLGFEMAGYRVAWASEFIDIARKTYKRNHPGVWVDERDIRKIKPEEILKATRMKKGQIDVLEGSPPCASFSTSGKRSDGWGKVRNYSDKKQRTDDLFFEFARILEGLQPRAFVAENVSGLVKGVAKGYFKEILAKLESCGYVVEARLVNAEWLGVPQSRERLIFVGVRKDIKKKPAFPQPKATRISLMDAIFPPPGEIEPETDISGYAIGREYGRIAIGEKGRYLNMIRPRLNEPCPTVTALVGVRSAASVVHPLDRRKFSIAELKRICGFPDDFRLDGTWSQKCERLGRSVPPPMMKEIAATLAKEVLS